jgi:flagellar hook-length control protein FliK
LRTVQERIDHIADQMATRLRLSQAAGGSQVQLQLRPRELGEVQVQLSVREGVVAAAVLVDRADTGRLLQTNLDELRRSLENQGLAIQHFTVDVRDGSGADAFARANGGHDGAGRGNDGNGSGGAGDAGINPGLEGDLLVAPEDHHDGNLSVLA